MSSISNIGGGTDLSQFFQSIAAANQASSTTATTATTASTAATSTPSTDGSTSGTPVQGHHRHGHHGGAGNSQLFSQLQSAVTRALQSAGSSDTDPNQTIEDAIAKVFQNSNNSTSANSAATSQTSADPDAASANTPASTTDGTSGTNGSSGLQAFFQTLQSAGIDPQQFHQDFLTAVQSVQNGGSANPSLAFQSLPTGSIIDTTG